VSDVALDEGRNPSLRARAIAVFRGCFDLLEILKDEHKSEIKAFGERLIQAWSPFLLSAIKSRLPEADLSDGQPAEWNSLIALKYQAIKTLAKIRVVFSELLVPQSMVLFQAVWEELSTLQVAYSGLYVENGAQSRLEDRDSLPCGLDLLVLEEVDFLKSCFRAAPVKAELEAQLNLHPSAADTPWFAELVRMLVAYARITSDEEGMWALDSSLYLAEDASITANYTARAATGDLLIKLGEWYGNRSVDVLLRFTKTLFEGGQSAADWRSQESALFLFGTLLGDLIETDRSVSAETTADYLQLVDHVTTHSTEPLLLARGFLVGGLVAVVAETPPVLLERTIAAVYNKDPDMEIPQVAAMKAFTDYVQGQRVPADMQAPMINAIAGFLDGRELDDFEGADDLNVTVAEALRSIISVDVKVVLRDDVPAIALLFSITRYGAAYFQTMLIINEAFEEIVLGIVDAGLYASLCERVLPSMTAVYDAADLSKDDDLVTSITELLVYLIQHGPEPLPVGFVATTLSRVSQLLMVATEGEVLRPGAECVKYMLMHDHHQVFNWRDANGLSGLEVCLHIIDRLLGSAVSDDSASEVGGVAAELVEKAGRERLGPFLPQLLQAVATRLVAAQKTPIIQSLAIVFARLAIGSAADVVEFLSAIQIDGQSGLDLVLAKWLENSIEFTGYDAIRQNVIAISKIYSLNDARVAQAMVKGDQIISDSNRIMTRSQARLNPIKYTSVPASLKILKVLVDELKSAMGSSMASFGASAAAAATAADGSTTKASDNSDDEEGWVDDDDFLDLNNPLTREELLSYANTGTSRQRDGETHAYLQEFFLQAARDNVAGFQQWFTMLTADEQQTLNGLAAAA
jgi:hypothetical protein